MDDSLLSKSILNTKGLTKRFAGVVAIEKVDFILREGEIHAIMGENGAGKSTFCNVVTGIFPADEGEIYLSGERVRFTHPRQALDLGIRMVYQERNLIPYLTGAQSICLGLEEKQFGLFTNEKQIQSLAEKVRNVVDSDVPLNVEVRWLSPSQQQMIEILRAIVYEPKLLILDEPTASLGNEEVLKLFKVLRQLKERGVAIIIVSHRLTEVYSIADAISIFRNGRLIITEKTEQLSRASAIRHMLGREIKSQFPEIVSYATDENLLEVKNLADYSGKLKRIDLKIRKGEVVGLFGLLGSGRTELAETVYGIFPKVEGQIFFHGEELTDKYDTKYMIDQGVLMVPEDRRRKGLFSKGFRIKENLTIGLLLDEIAGPLKTISVGKEKKCLGKITSSDVLRLKYSNPYQDVEELSGGNQQKIVIGRWIFKKNMKLLLMDEPTQGIDVGVKYDIYLLMRSLAKIGIGILFISSDLPELAGVCDRLYILKDGTIKAEFGREQLDIEKVMEMVI